MGAYSLWVLTFGTWLLPRAAYARAGLSNWFCPSVVVVVVVRKKCITAVLETKTISKQEVYDKMYHILAYVYLVKHKALLFSEFSTFFLIIGVIHHFI